MTVLDGTNTENNSTSISKPLHFWKSFKKIKEEEQTRKLEIDDEKSTERKLNKEKQAESDNFNSSSNVSFNPTTQTSKGSTMVQESSSSADSFFGSSVDESDKCVNACGLMHLNKPLFQDNAKKYYEDRGRMPTADWKSGGSSCVNREKMTDIMKRPEMQKKTIATVALSKPSDEFSNFVENSVSNKTAYSAHANVEKNSIDNPFVKIQQLINRKPLEAIHIPISVRTSFLKSLFDCHLLNNIDIFGAIDLITSGNSKAAETCVEEGVLNQNEHCKSFASRGKQIHNCCPNLDFDDCDIVTYVNSLTDEENTAKRESRRSGMAYGDDMFAFVENPPESKYQISSSPVPSARKISPHSFPFDRVKAVCREKVKVNKALDSDDTFNISSDLESSSVSRVSMRVKYETMKKKMNKITSSCNKSENTCILPDGNDSSKVLENRNQLLNRCLRGSHDYFKIHENNVVEITKVKVGTKPEPLLKPISTRYFSKPSTADGELCNENNNLMKEDIEIGKEERFISTDVSNLKTTLLDSSPSENLEEGNKESDNADFLNESSGNIDNVESANSRSDYDNVSNVIITNDICAEFCRKDIGIESALIIDDTETDNEEHCNLLAKHEEITKSASISKKARESPKILEKLDINDNYDDADDAFDIENIQLFLSKDKNIMRVLCGEMTNDCGVSIVDKDHNISEIQSLKSDLKSFNNNQSPANASMSSNMSSDSENSSNSNLLFNINENIFNNVNIELSKLKTDGLASDDNQAKDMKFHNDIVSLKDENLQLNVYPLNSIGNTTSKQISSNEKVQLDCSSTNFKPESVSQEKLHHQRKTAKESKKMEKYRITLENFKRKSSSEADTKEENKKVQQSDDESEFEKSHLQESLHQRPILKEIQKQKLHLTLRQFV